MVRGYGLGATGSVVATDIDLQRLGDLPGPVELHRHDIAREERESAAYDLVHCRFVLQHLAEPAAALRRMAAAVAPGGWLVVEEGDTGLSELAGAAESARASLVLHDVANRFTGPMSSTKIRRFIASDEADLLLHGKNYAADSVLSS